MPLRVLDAGTLRTITTLTAKQGGVERRIRTAKIQDGGALRTVAIFADPLTLSASPPIVSGAQSSAGAVLVNTASTIAIPAGGLAPYTYSWARTSGVGSANSPTSATTNFSATIGPGTQSGDFRVTVTDSGGQTATADVSATFNNLGGGFEP